jgi:hypothetical protein
MEPSFITIAEACAKTGRSASTVRRLIHTITQDDAHEDRTAIEPTTKQVAALKKKGENFTWKIREDILLKHFTGAPTAEKKSSSKAGSDILSILQSELSLKNQQIEKQWEVIHALNDRLREGNILMGSLQKRLGPPQDLSPSESVVETATMASSAEASKKEKRGLFAWMRR